jgi:hypothetical protein
MASITSSYNTIGIDMQTGRQRADGPVFVPTDEVFTVDGTCYYIADNTITIFQKSTSVVHEIPKTREPKLPNMQWDGSR